MQINPLAGQHFGQSSSPRPRGQSPEGWVAGNVLRTPSRMLNSHSLVAIWRSRSRPPHCFWRRNSIVALQGQRHNYPLWAPLLGGTPSGARLGTPPRAKSRNSSNNFDLLRILNAACLRSFI